MAGKTKKPEAVVKLPEPADKEKADAMAKLALRPSANAAIVIEEYSKPFGELDLAALLDSLEDAVQDVWDGDLKRCEAMLIGQAHSLHAIFANLAQRAAKAECMDKMERYLRLALKAQSQCRTTLEALAAIKNPPVVFARQANIAHGPQQVNNGMVPAGGATIAHASSNQAEQNKLLEVEHEQRLDTGTPGVAGGADPTVAALGKIDRPPHR